MTFVAPAVLLGLLLVPVAVVAYLRHDQRRRQHRAAFAHEALMPAVAPRRTGARRHVAPVLYLLAFAVLLVALARPKAEATVKVNKASVMLVIDHSGSMQSTDVPGGRLNAAKVAGNTFLDMVPDDVRTGLLAFNQTVELLQSPVTDRASTRSALDGLVPAGSTATGDALARALQVLRPEGQTGTPAPAAIILLSDGKSVRGQDPLPVAQQAGKDGVKIYTVALGTANGTLQTKRKDGTIRTQQVPPDTQTMAAIAKASGGETFQSANVASLSAVYEKLGKQVATKREKQEITTWFAGGALALLVLGAGTSLALVGRLP
ncbi:MAG: VWA domain-containing protein [Solirubrobacteraceae bacterium]|nr:VWA domain-containing protein [Patulibacter sp.]